MREQHQEDSGAAICRAVAAPPRRHQTQAEANAYWAPHEHKKWVLTFTTGTRRQRTTRDFYVSSRTFDGAKRAGLAAADMLCHKWARRANCNVRLATAYDLGCIYTGGTPQRVSTTFAFPSPPAEGSK